MEGYVLLCKLFMLCNPDNSTKASGDRIKNIRIRSTKSSQQFIDLPVDTEDDDDGEIEA